MQPMMNQFDYQLQTTVSTVPQRRLPTVKQYIRKNWKLIAVVVAITVFSIGLIVGRMLP